MPSDNPAELEVRSSEGQAVRYRLAPEFHAKRPSTPLSPGDRIAQSLDENLAVFHGSASATDLAKGEVWPVYRAPPSGRFAVPTGRLWVRFTEGTSATEKREEISKAGFDIEELPAWAPQAAWVRASSGKIADALAAASRLQALPDVAHVELQMLTAVARKQPH